MASCSLRAGLGMLALAALLAVRPAAGDDKAGGGETGEIEALHRGFLEAYDEGDLATALRRGEQLDGLVPENALLAYDLARLRAMLGDPAAALGWLREAADRGFSRLALLDAEVDFAGLREKPAYVTIRRWIAENRRVAVREFEQQVAEHPPRIVAPGDLDPAQPAPVIVALHGRGGLAEPLLNLWRAAARQAGAVLVVPQALEPYAEGFQWGTQEETAYQTLQAVEAAAAQYPIDRDCVLLTGFSQGGRRSIATAFRHPELFAGVVVVGSAMDGETALPATPGHALPPFFFLVGENDRVLERTRATVERFDQHGIASKLVVAGGVGHSFPRDHRRHLRRAIRFALRCEGRSEGSTKADR